MVVYTFRSQHSRGRGKWISVSSTLIDLSSRPASVTVRLYLRNKQTPPHQTIPHEVPKYAGNACESLTEHLINNRLSRYSPTKYTQNMIHKIYRYSKKNITKTSISKRYFIAFVFRCFTVISPIKKKISSICFSKPNPLVGHSSSCL